jgi:regulator of protease activity HflC (stomatin/prohibitin superfamily)
MEKMNSSRKKLIKIGTILTGLIILFLIILSSCLITIEPGERGVVFHKWGDGLDTELVYDEGVHVVAPWNVMIIYDVKQKTEEMSMNVLDKTGLEVGIDVSIQYKPMPNKIGYLHQEIGINYKDIIVIPYPKNVVREITGQFTAEELYSTKRDQLQNLCEKMLREKFETKNLLLQDVLIRDVNLPLKIKNGIEAKEAQKQKNELAEKINAEKKFLATAAITESEGIKQAKILRAQGESEAIRLKQNQLKQSPQYIEFIKWQGFAESGNSPYGENNVFGAGTTILKGLK